MSDAFPTLSRAQSFVGRKVNNYNVVSLLGVGGMGAVYVAEHPFIDRKVAIKVLKREHTEDESLIRRFFNEAKAASAIRHPHIVEIFDMGELDDGIPYIVMELLAGESLRALIEREKQLDVSTAIRITHQTAAALTAAHAKGIIHRDLKPDNLHMVAAESGRGEHVKVLDFGIAKLRPEMAGSNGGTNTGAVMGTPPYMSPEQCLGINADIDSRTDIYALGVILFQMLCGRTPFVGTGMGEILVAHVTKQPPLPSAFNAKVPPDVEGIILKALSKRREDRFATMSELQTALMAVTAQENAPLKTMTLPEADRTSAAVATPPETPAPRSVRPTTPLPAATKQGGNDLHAKMQTDLGQVPRNAGSSSKHVVLLLAVVVFGGVVAFLWMGRRGGEARVTAPVPVVTPGPVLAPPREALPVPVEVAPTPPTQPMVQDAHPVPAPVARRKSKVHRDRMGAQVDGTPAPAIHSPQTTKLRGAPVNVVAPGPAPPPVPPKPKKKIIPSLEF
ncbi:MAG: serine/threonine protein kinase [Myxococcales bacterium]|nr:serine/threonine protein kinase [Myxococcales bacterium]